eukprot:TRINITY_DN408_c1_g2_i1.p1 TRINITY_DN408_c1_g2~~TRINITY_DN408_c1_g2_i1.p1  ORF type:complete len:161 (+),score=37.11 TRINITY_DN408_c1_g2_i1:54-536(+)
MLRLASRSVLQTGARRWKYDTSLLKHFHKPKGVGRLNEKSPDVGTGVFGSAACGDLARIQIEYNDETGTIANAKFKTFGCGSAIASSSYACSVLIGKTLDEVLEVRNSNIQQALSLPPVKVHCSLLTEGCIRRAVADLLKKRPELESSINEESKAQIALV